MGGWDEVGEENWDYHWDSHSHDELYRMVKTDAKGAGALGATHDAWDSFAKLMSESAGNIDRLVDEAGGAWEGQAAGSMQGAVSPLTRWADHAAADGHKSTASTQAHMDAFSTVANSMPEPVDVPSKKPGFLQDASFSDLLAGQHDEDPAERAAQEAKQRAVELMGGFTATSQDASGSLGTFAAPEEETQTSVEKRQSPGGSIDSDDYRDTEPGSGGPDSGGPGGGPGSAATPPPPPVPPAPPGGTDTAQAGPTPLSPPAAHLPSSSTTPASNHPLAPVAGMPYPPGQTPAGGAGTRGRGGGGVGNGPGGPGGSPVGGPVGGAPGTGGPTGRPGIGPVTEGGPVRGGTPATRGGPGAVPMGAAGAGRGNGEDDKEHNAAAYLRDYHDDFWDNTPPVAPPVIGLDDD